jgi:hypothetical protein
VTIAPQLYEPTIHSSEIMSFSASGPVPANHALDRYLLTHVPIIVTLQKTRSGMIKENIEAEILRIQMATNDHYDNISTFSTHWASDDTGGSKDSSLFVETISKLNNEDGIT